jgi:AraC family transcriptional regulator
VVEHIDAHVAADLSLARLAEVAGISASHLKTVFKRSTGVPVHQFVVQRRVERAVSLLRGGEMPASEVALEAGFAHQSHMARCMRRLLGVTPTRVSQGA